MMHWRSDSLNLHYWSAVKSKRGGLILLIYPRVLLPGSSYGLNNADWPPFISKKCGDNFNGLSRTQNFLEDVLYMYNSLEHL